MIADSCRAGDSSFWFSCLSCLRPPCSSSTSSPRAAQCVPGPVTLPHPPTMDPLTAGSTGDQDRRAIRSSGLTAVRPWDTQATRWEACLTCSAGGSTKALATTVLRSLHPPSVPDETHLCCCGRERNASPSRTESRCCPTTLTSW